MQERRDEAIEYFVEQYRTMLAEHLDDYIENFADYVEPSNDD